MAVIHQRYSIQIAKHEASGLFLAQSPELPALMVPGQNLAELQDRIPQSIREILEHTGARVLSVLLEDDDTDPPLPADFSSARRRVVRTEIEARQ